LRNRRPERGARLVAARRDIGTAPCATPGFIRPGNRNDDQRLLAATPKAVPTAEYER
jgi:hypothetical protein